VERFEPRLLGVCLIGGLLHHKLARVYAESRGVSVNEYANKKLWRCNRIGFPSESATFHIPPNEVVKRVTAHRKPPEERIGRLRHRYAMGILLQA
jgi:hypothetical protein